MGIAKKSWNAARLKLIETEKEEEYGRLGIVNGVMAVLADHDFLIMKNHGFSFPLGKTMDEAGQKPWTSRPEPTMRKCCVQRARAF